jgi:hypothetical protein
MFKLLLDDPQQMLLLGADARLQVFKLLNHLAQLSALVLRPALARVMATFHVTSSLAFSRL